MSDTHDTIVDVIIAEHARLRSDFDNLDALPDDDRQGRKNLWKDLKKDLLAHHDAEEDTLFAALVQTTADARNESLHAVSEHGEHKKILEQMEDLSFDHDEWQAKLAELRHDVIHHLDEEEEDVLPIAREVLTKEKSRALAKAYSAAKDG